MSDIVPITGPCAPCRQASAQPLGVQLMNMSGLLQAAARSLCGDEIDGVGEQCAEISALVTQICLQLREPSKEGDGTSAETAQKLRTALLGVMEARAFYLAALRRWRRSLRVRRALVESSEEFPGYGEQLTRRC